MAACSCWRREFEMSLTSIDYQIMWNRLIVVIEEQATTLIRNFSDFSTRSGDLSVGLLINQAL